MRLFIGFLAAWTAITTASVGAKEPTKAELLKAIESFTGIDIHLSGAIEQDAADEVEAPGAPGVVVQKVVIGGSGSGNEFFGDVDVAIMKNGAIALASKDALPALKVFRSGEVTLCNQTHTEEPIHPKRLMSNLKRLSDWKRLAKAVSESSKIRFSNQGTNTNMRVVLDSGYLQGAKEPAEAGGFGGGAIAGGGAVRIQVGGSPLEPTVVDLIATFTMNQSMELVGLTFEVQYDDPMAAMMAKVGGGAFRIQGNAVKPAKEDDEKLGKLIRLDFDIDRKIPANLEAFSKEAQELLGKK